ncbi:MAG: phage portal protein [Candidatus Nealsonbacteria bacterium]|nr:phage portal protein [Candidatus Nealsonbacteria bacterium]
MWPFRNRRKARTSLPGHLRARYDAAQTMVENARHWAMADGLSADAAMTPDVRRTLRNRARYEVANNSYAKGMVLTIAGDCVGTGPRLQLLTEDNETNRIVEQAFAEWASAVDLAAKLRTMRMAKSTDGEAFAVLVNNPDLDHPVKLDLCLVEADQITTPVTAINRPEVVDGIELDGLGHPEAYHVLQEHPGAYGIGPALVTSRRIPATAATEPGGCRPPSARPVCRASSPTWPTSRCWKATTTSKTPGDRSARSPRSTTSRNTADTE